MNTNDISVTVHEPSNHHWKSGTQNQVHAPMKHLERHELHNFCVKFRSVWAPSSSVWQKTRFLGNSLKLLSTSGQSFTFDSHVHTWLHATSETDSSLHGDDYTPIDEISYLLFSFQAPCVEFGAHRYHWTKRIAMDASSISVRWTVRVWSRQGSS